jgi:hypothetical protein
LKGVRTPNRREGRVWEGKGGGKGDRGKEKGETRKEKGEKGERRKEKGERQRRNEGGKR